MVDLVFIPASAYRPSPEAAQIPINGNHTLFPWALTGPRAASVWSSLLSTQGGVPGQVARAVRSHCLSESRLRRLPGHGAGAEPLS